MIGKQREGLGIRPNEISKVTLTLPLPEAPK